MYLSDREGVEFNPSGVGSEFSGMAFTVGFTYG